MAVDFRTYDKVCNKVSEISRKKKYRNC